MRLPLWVAGRRVARRVVRRVTAAARATSVRSPRLMADTPKPLGWGRVFPAARLSTAPETRRGAWYRVLSEGRSRIVLEVRGKRVDLSKGAVEVRPTLPDKFTVVYRAADEPTPPRKSAGALGRVYAVCPQCARRTRLFGEPRTLQCRECGHEGEIAWWETG